MFQTLKSKLVFNTIAFGLIIGGIFGIVLYYLFPEYYTQWYIVILLYFIVLESCSVFILNKMSRTATARQMVNGYLMAKTLKIIISLFLIVVYALVVKEKPLIVNFAISFVILYLCFLVLESMQYIKMENKLKDKKNEKI